MLLENNIKHCILLQYITNHFSQITWFICCWVSWSSVVRNLYYLATCDIAVKILWCSQECTPIMEHICCTFYIFHVRNSQSDNSLFFKKKKKKQIGVLVISGLFLWLLLLEKKERILEKKKNLFRLSVFVTSHTNTSTAHAQICLLCNFLLYIVI